MFNLGDFILYEYNNVRYFGVILAKQPSNYDSPYIIGYITFPHDISGDALYDYESFTKQYLLCEDMTFINKEVFNKINKVYDISLKCSWSSDLILTTRKQIINYKLEKRYV